MACRLAEEARAVDDRAALVVRRAEIKAPDAREGNRAGAHGAGFERHEKIGVGEPFGPERGAGGADRQHFGMRGGVGELPCPVAGAGDDLAALRDDGADGYLAARAGGAGLLQRDLHVARLPHVGIRFLSPAGS